ncbi:MAG: hypothetical protein K8Q91_01895 [Candidatus Vogelbacteria bacterium]|nr:hypothetical protein [Candidatus Vogelbacteria bacterium]
MEIYLVTQNTDKIAAANSVFTGTDIVIKGVDKDYEEIQADTSAKVAQFTALEAAKDINKPTIREDHSLYINAISVPGPYMSYFNKHLSVDNLLKILENFPDRTGYLELAACLAYPDGKTVDFSYKVPIHFKSEVVVADPRNGWDSLICLEGESRAFTEYPSSERVGIWSQNFKKIAEYLKK